MTQARALELLKTGANVFLSGPPGSGKSYVLEQFIKTLARKGRKTAVCASTGIAASLIGGVTLHSWSGIGVRRQLNRFEREKLLSNPGINRRLNEVETLIIDEISMLSAETVDGLSDLLMQARESLKPFGGMQIVVCGDFFQLPPVGNGLPNYAFSAKAWQAANFKACYLDEQHRVAADELSEVLLALREQRLTARHVRLLLNRQGIKHYPVTRLLTHNHDASVINRQQLDLLPGKAKAYFMKGQEAWTKSLLAPPELLLKVGAEVMFVANDYRRGFVNGSQGKVVAFKHGLPLIQLKSSGKYILAEAYCWRRELVNGKIIEAIQLPLKLAWALTIHKSQGMSLDAAEIDLSRSFTYGMGYVALSRLKSFEGLYLLGLNSRSLQLDKNVLSFDQRIQAESKINEGGRFTSSDRLALEQAKADPRLINFTEGLKS